MKQDFQIIPDCTKYELNSEGVVRHRISEKQIKRYERKVTDVLIYYTDGRRAQKNVPLMLSELFGMALPVKSVTGKQNKQKTPKPKPIKKTAPKPVKEKEAPQRNEALAKLIIDKTDSTKAIRVYLLISKCNYTYSAAGEIVGLNSNAISGLFYRTKTNPTKVAEAEALLSEIQAKKP